VLRPLVEPALAAIPSTSPAHLEAKRLLRFIQYFLPSDAAAVPNNSILQEFIGNSIFETG
ncbi:MAG: nucleoside kinase, partial [Clostridiales bacterium]